MLQFVECIYRHGAQTYLFQINPRERDLFDRQIRVRISARVVCFCVVPKRSEGLHTLKEMVCAKCLLYINESEFLSD